MLVARIDLIFSAHSRLSKSAPATNNDFALAMIHVTSHSSTFFDSVNLKSKDSTIP